MNKTKLWSWAALIICAVLFLIWPTAHTIAARKLLLVIAAGIGVVLWVRSEDRYAILKSHWLIFLGLLLVWVVFHAAFLSQNGSEAWGELRGQWFPAYLAVLAGIGLALAGRNIDSTVFKFSLLSILSAQTILYLLVSLFRGMQEGHMSAGYWGINDIKLGTDLKTSLTINAELLAALSCAMFVDSFKAGVQGIKRYVWLLPIAMALYVAIFTSSLNAIIVVSGAIGIALAIIAYKQLKRVQPWIVATIALAVVGGGYAVTTMPATKLAMQRAISNVSESVDVDKNQNWKNTSNQAVPLNSLGEKIPESFHHRIARATVGIRLIFENPLGYGVTRHAYQQLVERKYPDARMIGSSENGYINLVSAVGFPALILFMLAVISVYRGLNKSNLQWKRPIAWMITISLAHLALDAIERDHFFEIYLFLLALAATHLIRSSESK